MAVRSFQACGSVAISIALAFGRSGVLPPVVAAWGPNVTFALAGGYLFAAVRH